MFLLHLILKKPLRFPRKNHLYFFFLGLTNFCLNYVMTYTAQTYAPSAMIALTFTTIIHFNMLGTWLFFKRPIHKNVWIGSILGALGIFLLFYEDLQKADLNSLAAFGMSLGLVSTISASAGNMFSYKNSLMKVPVMASTAWGMFYGTLCTGLLCLIFKEDFIFPTSAKFWSAMLYLSVVGTIITFLAYFTLIGRIGAARAAYTSVASPVIAVAISAVFENLQITYLLASGMCLCLLGNVFTLYQGKSSS